MFSALQIGDLFFYFFRLVDLEAETITIVSQGEKLGAEERTETQQIGRRRAGCLASTF